MFSVPSCFSLTVSRFLHNSLVTFQAQSLKGIVSLGLFQTKGIQMCLCMATAGDLN